MECSKAEYDLANSGDLDLTCLTRSDAIALTLTAEMGCVSALAALFVLCLILVRKTHSMNGEAV